MPYLKKIVRVTEFQDITVRKETETKLKKSQNMLETILKNMPGGTVLIGDDYRIYQVNARTCEITGYKEEELVGQLCDIICPKGMSSKRCPIWEDGEDGFRGMDTAVKCRDGRKNPILKNAQIIIIDGKYYVLENFQDITIQKKMEEELRQLSVKDHLTGVYNRQYLDENMRKELERSMRYRNDLSIFICDIDFFKKINDKFGHQNGDCVLVTFADLIKKLFAQK